MTTVNLTLNLPDGLAQAASRAGLLLPNAIEKMLNDALRKKEIGDFFATADKLKTANFPEMTLEEIQQEVNIVRHAKESGNV